MKGWTFGEESIKKEQKAIGKKALEKGRHKSWLFVCRGREKKEKRFKGVDKEKEKEKARKTSEGRIFVEEK